MRIDRGSMSGTMGDGKITGGNRNRAEYLINGDYVLIVDRSTCPHFFKVSIAKEAVIHKEESQPVSNDELNVSREEAFT